MTRPRRRAALLASAAGAVVAMVACAVVIAATPNDAVWIVDAGAKELLAFQFLEHGPRALAFRSPAAVFDPSGRAFPIPPPFAIATEAGFVSQYPPAYPATAVPFLALLGRAGLRVPAALGVAACAFLFVYWLAPAVGPRRAFGGGLALALATPLFFYGVTIWEHSLTVALSLAAVVVLGAPGRNRALLAGLLAGAACWYREELVWMLPALALAALLVGRPLRDAVWLGLGAALPGAALAAFNGAVHGHPFGIHVRHNVHATPPLGEILRDLGALLSGYGASPTEGLLLAALAVAALALGLVVARNHARLPLALALAATLGLGVWLRGTLAIATAPVPFVELARWNGLAIQLPLFCLAGIGLAHVRRSVDLAPLRLGCYAGLSFLACMLPFRVMLSDFSSGGHWGPRMLLPALPALVALALAAVTPGSDARGGRVGGARLARVAWAALLAAGLASSALAVRLLDDQKREARALAARIEALDANVIVTNHPALAQQLPGLFRAKPLLLVGAASEFAALAAALEAHRQPDFVFVEAAGRRLPARPGADCRAAGRHRGRHVPRIFDVDLWRCRSAPRS